MYLLQFFKYDHLPEHLQEVSKPFCDLAHQLAENLEDNAETTTALRKLLEAKDCAVRSLLFKSEQSWKAGLIIYLGDDWSVDFDDSVVCGFPGLFVCSKKAAMYLFRARGFRDFLSCNPFLLFCLDGYIKIAVWN